MFEELKRNAGNIKLSGEAKEKIIENCYSKTQKSEENTMKTTKIKFRKVYFIAAIVAVCAISAGAVISHVTRGFKDVVKDGAVVGTEFNEEADMIKLEAQLNEEKLILSVNVLDYANAPYIYAEEFKISNYVIVDKDGNILEKNAGDISPTNGFVDGKAEFKLPVDMPESGEYALIINSFVLSSKADQPLHVNGKWICTFVK